jgi:hypothetical protein
MISLMALALVAGEMSPAKRQEFNDLGEAAGSIVRCRNTLPPRNDISIAQVCHSQWRSLTYTMTDNWNFEVLASAADGREQKWTIMCREDRVEGYKLCSMLTGKNGSYFQVASWTSGDRVSWGTDAYPGSQKVAKIGDETPLRFMEDQQIDVHTSEAMLNLMKVSESAIFRFQTWPENLSSDIKVDLTNFQDMLTFLHAANSAFSTKDT